jgi:hypothetical protein
MLPLKGGMMQQNYPNQHTPWYPTTIRPVRKGVYRIQAQFLRAQMQVMYAYWNGTFWGAAFDTIQGAYNRRQIRSPLQQCKWFGLTEEGIQSLMVSTRLTRELTHDKPCNVASIALQS